MIKIDKVFFLNKDNEKIVQLIKLNNLRPKIVIQDRKTPFERFDKVGE